MNYIKVDIRSSVADDNGNYVRATVRHIETDMTVKETYLYPHIAQVLGRLNGGTTTKQTAFPYTFTLTLG